MTSVHPPSRAILQSTVAIISVIVLVKGTELHAIVRCEELVARVVAKVKAVESISSITAHVESISQTVLVSL